MCYCDYCLLANVRCRTAVPVLVSIVRPNEYYSRRLVGIGDRVYSCASNYYRYVLDIVCTGSRGLFTDTAVPPDGRSYKYLYWDPYCSARSRGLTNTNSPSVSNLLGTRDTCVPAVPVRERH